MSLSKRSNKTNAIAYWLTKEFIFYKSLILMIIIKITNIKYLFIPFLILLILGSPMP